ncbi:MAG: D-tyrosyl-tRNA(Tyr) deacylase [Elusimicrobia bacterium RIFOXYB2_FULL_62_6]|nr:MAG: D-tyrosyl-tRNA(Tyr) deacylase [Elusimicrobia bacterium RIFOXYB2_FULL_62_6]
MRALIQRVSRAGVLIEGRERARIGRGYAVLLGVGEGDAEKDAEFLADKTANLRIFSNDEGKFDHSLLDVGGEALVVSQFTLYGEAEKGRRPDFARAAKPDAARRLYEYFVKCLAEKGVAVKTGVFAAHMTVEIINDGPVTIWLDSRGAGDKARQAPPDGGLPPERP